MIRLLAIFYWVPLFCRQSDTVCQLGCSVRCNEDSSKTSAIVAVLILFFPCSKFTLPFVIFLVICVKLHININKNSMRKAKYSIKVSITSAYELEMKIPIIEPYRTLLRIKQDFVNSICLIAATEKFYVTEKIKNKKQKDEFPLKK